MELEITIRKRASAFAAEVAALVKQSIAEQVARAVGASKPATRPAKATGARVARAKPYSPKGRKLRLPPHCIAPNCTKPYVGGSKRSFTCDQHFKASKVEKRKWLAAWRETKVKG